MSYTIVGNIIYFYDSGDLDEDTGLPSTAARYFHIDKSGSSVTFWKHNILNEDNEILKKINPSDETQEPLEAKIKQQNNIDYVFVDRKTLCFSESDTFKHIFEKGLVKLNIRLIRNENEEIPGNIRITNETFGSLNIEEVSNYSKVVNQDSVIDIRVEKDNYKPLQDKIKINNVNVYKTYTLIEQDKFDFKFTSNAKNAKVTITKDDGEEIANRHSIDYLIRLYKGKYYIKFETLVPESTDDKYYNNGIPTHETFEIYINTDKFSNNTLNEFRIILSPTGWEKTTRVSYCTIDDVLESSNNFRANPFITPYLIAKSIIKAENDIDLLANQDEPLRLQRIFTETDRNSILAIRNLAILKTSLLLLNFDKAYFTDWDEYKDIKQSTEKEIEKITKKFEDPSIMRLIKKLGKLN